MTLYLGADHRGFALKEQLKSWLQEQGHEVHDHGAASLDKEDDYPDFAVAVAQAVAKDPTGRGIVLCGSGIGMAIAANKITGVRASVVTDPTLAQLSRHDDNINVLSLGADFLSEQDAKAIVTAWLAADFSGEPRYQRRLEKIAQLE